MTLYDIRVRGQQGEEVALSGFASRVLLIVNTATHCGFTPQYEGLQKLYERYQDRGFAVLDFPCNQFGNQAPESDSEIASFCALRYATSFPQFAKIDVNGPNESPLYRWLKAQKGGLLGSQIKWNFTKFLVDRQGNVVRRFASTVPPEQIAQEIEREIERQPV